MWKTPSNFHKKAYPAMETPKRYRMSQIKVPADPDFLVEKQILFAFLDFLCHKTCKNMFPEN